MPSLAELQRLFFGALHGTPEAALLRAVLPSARLSAADRIEIYRGMYFWRLRGALAEDFPKLEKALGEDGFSDLARDYLLAHPSRHPSLRHLGAGLPGHLAGGGAAGRPPWAADLAALEWARVDAFDAADASPVSAAELRQTEPERWPGLRFRLAPCVRMLDFGWPVHEVWSDPNGAAPDPRPTSLRVWRAEGGVFHALMDELERPALATLASGGTFADVCEALADAAGLDAPRQAAGLLARWLGDALIADFSPRPS